MTVFRGDGEAPGRLSWRMERYAVLCWVSVYSIVILLTVGVVWWGIGEALRWGR